MENIYISKLDTSHPAVYLIKVKNHLSMQGIQNIKHQFLSTVNAHWPGNSVFILDDSFDAVVKPTDEEMKKLGWEKRQPFKEKLKKIRERYRK